MSLWLVWLLKRLPDLGQDVVEWVLYSSLKSPKFYKSPGGTWLLNLGFRFLELGVWFLDFVFWNLAFGTWILELTQLSQQGHIALEVIDGIV